MNPDQILGFIVGGAVVLAIFVISNRKEEEPDTCEEHGECAHCCPYCLAKMIGC